MRRRRIAHAPPDDRTPGLLVAHGALRFVLFPIPVVTVFWVDHVGLSLGGVPWLQAVFAGAVVAAELPSGYLADRVGHRTALLAGASLWAAAWALYASATTLAGVVVAEVVLGPGLAFASGADSALLYRALARRGAEADYLRWEGRTRAAGQAAEAASSAAGGLLYAVAPRLPFWLQVPVGLASLGCAAAMREPARDAPGARRAHLRAALHLVRHALRRHARLRSAVALHVALSLPSFLMVWLVQRDAPDEDRASVLSLAALCFRLGSSSSGRSSGASWTGSAWTPPSRSSARDSRRRGWLRSPASCARTDAGDRPAAVRWAAPWPHATSGGCPGSRRCSRSCSAAAATARGGPRSGCSTTSRITAAWSWPAPGS